MAYAYLEVDLKEISTADLLEELEGRYLGDEELSSILKCIKSVDAQKYELFNRIKDRHSTLELVALFNEEVSAHRVPKEQLKIVF